MTETIWQKSSFSSGDPNTNCIEIADQLTGLRIRESENPCVVLTPGRTALRALLHHLKDHAQAVH